MDLYSKNKILCKKYTILTFKKRARPILVESQYKLYKWCSSIDYHRRSLLNIDRRFIILTESSTKSCTPNVRITWSAIFHLMYEPKLIDSRCLTERNIYLFLRARDLSVRPELIWIDLYIYKTHWTAASPTLSLIGLVLCLYIDELQQFLTSCILNRVNLKIHNLISTGAY